MTYQETYKKWLNSPALSPEEKAELAAIAGDDKEIESRFFGPLEFGTAGLRGIMGMGIKHGNTVRVEVEGEDETEAAAQIEAFFKANL